MTALLKVDNLRRRFDRRLAVDGVSFELERGGILGLLGPNGAGKTTTLRMIAGVLPADDGTIELMGEPLSHRRPALKRHLGYLPDTPPLHDAMRVADYLRYCARLRGVPSNRSRQRVDAVMEQCDLSAVARRLIGNLSRGFRQRVGLAQAVVHQPALLVLDEPTLGLDPLQVQSLRSLIESLRRDHGIILSTHLLPEVQRLCDRVLILNEGRAVYAGELEGGGDAGYRLTLRQAQSPQAVSTLPGVARVEPEGGGSYRLWLTDAGETDRLLSAAIERGWGVRAWQAAAPTLEALFVEHVHRENPCG